MSIKSQIKTTLTNGPSFVPDKCEPLGFLIFERSKPKPDQALVVFKLDLLIDELPGTPDEADVHMERAEMILLGNGIDPDIADVEVRYHTSIKDGFRKQQVPAQYSFIGKGEPDGFDGYVEQIYQPATHVPRNRPEVDPDAKRVTGQL